MLLLNLALTVYFWSLTGVSILISFFTCLFVYPFVDQKTYARIFEKLSGTMMLYSMVIPGFWRVTIYDYREDPTWGDKRYVIVANHISFMDSLITSIFPLKKKYMMGRIFARVPVFGWIVKTAGFILVDNKDETTLFNAVDKAVETMKDGCSFMIYPEGKRTPGHLEKFKTGAYRIAQRTGVPILPICLKGTNIGMPIGGLVSPANIEIFIGEPFKVGEKWGDVISGIERTREFISEHL